jgi:hypothetical protein
MILNRIQSRCMSSIQIKAIRLEVVRDHPLVNTSRWSHCQPAFIHWNHACSNVLRLSRFRSTGWLIHWRQATSYLAVNHCWPPRTIVLVYAPLLLGSQSGKSGLIARAAQSQKYARVALSICTTCHKHSSCSREQMSNSRTRHSMCKSRLHVQEALSHGITTTT